MACRGTDGAAGVQIEQKSACGGTDRGKSRVAGSRKSAKVGENECYSTFFGAFCVVIQRLLRAGWGGWGRLRSRNCDKRDSGNEVDSRTGQRSGNLMACSTKGRTAGTGMGRSWVEAAACRSVKPGRAGFVVSRVLRRRGQELGRPATSQKRLCRMVPYGL